MTHNRFDSIGKYVEEAMASWQIPGLALAVVNGNEIVHMQGYGVRDVETREPITPETIFPIASSSKAFTAMGIGLLVDEGKLEWDKPVRNYLPDFELSDGYVSEKLTVRDLLCHRSGLPRHDLAWYGTNRARADLIRNLKYLEFSKGFREVWQYQNLMYVTAGYLAGQMTGLTWEDFTQQRIFGPLTMSRSCFSPDVMKQLGNYAMPYRIKRGKAEGKEDVLEVMEFYSDPVMGPAGAIHSNVQDLAKWLKVHLNEGQFEGQVFVSPGSLAQMHQPQMIMPVDGFMSTLLGTTISTYGLGWFVVPYRGHTLIHHGGNIDGFSTMVAFVPRENIGIVVLTNIEGRPLRDMPENQWNQRFHAMYDELYASIDRDRDVAADEQKQGAPLSHPIEAYVGEYAADGYGDFVVKLDGDSLLGWVAGDWFPLQHYHYDTFNLDLDRFEMRLPAIFQMNAQGEIDAVSLQLEPQIAPRLFKRKPIVIGDNVLAALTGRYDLPIEGMELAVTARNNRLFMTITGQAGEELLPYRMSDSEVEFLVKAAPGVRLGFRKDVEGVYGTAILKQPGQVFEAPRLSAS
jgi:CubicO group peptidase (beta-lactamase class C family)